MATKKLTITLPWLVNLTLVFANSAIVIGFAIAITEYCQNRSEFRVQLNQSIKEEKTKNAIEAIERTYSVDFMKSMALLKSSHDSTADEYIDAKNIVLNNYYLIAVVYRSEIADNEIIKNAIKTGLDSYMDINAFKSIPNTSKTKSEIRHMANNLNAN